MDLLVVDDNEADVDKLTEILSTWGMRFAVRHTVHEAIAFLNATPCDRVMLDVVIGGNPRGAHLVLESLRARGANTKVLIVSMAGNEGVVRRLKAEYLGIVSEVIAKDHFWDMLPLVSEFLKRGEPPGNGSSTIPPSAPAPSRPPRSDMWSRIWIVLVLLGAATVIYVVGAVIKGSYPDSALGYYVLNSLSLVAVVAAIAFAVGPSNANLAMTWALDVLRLWTGRPRAR